jgi:hypothetical protein
MSRVYAILGIQDYRALGYNQFNHCNQSTLANFYGARLTRVRECLLGADKKYRTMQVLSLGFFAVAHA